MIERLLYQVAKRLRELDVPVYMYPPLTCPCCGSTDVALVDIGFEVGTGQEVQVGDTHQCNRCLVYFYPGETCDEAKR